MRKVVDRMHMREITIAYGMTETSPVSFQSAYDDPIERRVSTVGRIQPHHRGQDRRPEGRIVPPGVPGELLTRGYSVMRGYWDDPAATAAAIDEARLMHTGDLATIDAEGYCNIVGRLKDMVIRGGENIYPREIEEFLYTHPAIAEVQAFGVPDTPTARSSASGSAAGRAQPSTRRRWSPFAGPRSPITRSPVTSASSTPSR